MGLAAAPAAAAGPEAGAEIHRLLPPLPFLGSLSPFVQHFRRSGGLRGGVTQILTLEAPEPLGLSVCYEMMSQWRAFSSLGLFYRNGSTSSWE